MKQCLRHTLKKRVPSDGNSSGQGSLGRCNDTPRKYPDLIVRVAGYSAVFIHLDRSVQEELLSRSLYGEAGV